MMFDQIKMMKQLAGLMGNMGEIREKVDQFQAELGEKTVEAEAGAGAVRVQMNGRFEVLSVQVDPAMVATLAGVGTDADRAMVQELISSAVNAAVLQVQELLKQSLGEAVGEMGISPPGE